MPVSRGSAGFPKLCISKCVAYDTVTTYTTVTLTTDYTGTLSFQIGTSNTNLGSVTWENITEDVLLTLVNPNKALFFKCVGSSGAILNEVRIVYS